MLKLTTCTLIPFLLLFGVSTAYAENDQTVVLGFGLGGHLSNHKHEIRINNLENFEWTANAYHYYLEWYAFEKFGIGLLMNNMSYNLGVTPDNHYQREYDYINKFITFNWVTNVSSSYSRAGLRVGIGNAECEFTEITNGNIVFNDSSSGSAAMLGTFYDFGGDDLGMRFSLGILRTDMDDINGYPVDSSGKYLTVDVRWVFN